MFGMVLMAESIPQFGKILSLVGGSTVTLLTFVLPPLCYMKLCDQIGPWSVVKYANDYIIKLLRVIKKKCTCRLNIQFFIFFDLLKVSLGEKLFRAIFFTIGKMTT